MYEEGATQQDGYGLAVNYDLGGGAVVRFGYGSTQTCGVYGGCAVGDSFSLGLAMSF
jgi:outer membrane protein OmpU